MPSLLVLFGNYTRNPSLMGFHTFMSDIRIFGHSFDNDKILAIPVRVIIQPGYYMLII